MKKLLAISLFILTAFFAKAQTADDVIAKYIEAVGGRAKIEAIKTMKISATLKAQGFELPGILYKKRPDKFELEFTFQGMTQKQGYDGTDAWMVDPFQGRTYAEKMDADAAKIVKYQAQFDDPLMNYARLGHKVVYIGEEDVDGSAALRLQLSTTEGDVYDYYFDKESSLLIRTKEHVKKQDGTTSDSETNYSDYNEVNGILMPFTIENVQEYQGQKSSSFMKIDKVEVNVEIDDAIFKMPK